MVSACSPLLGACCQVRSTAATAAGCWWRRRQPFWCHSLPLSRLLAKTAAAHTLNGQSSLHCAWVAQVPFLDPTSPRKRPTLKAKTGVEVMLEAGDAMAASASLGSTPAAWVPAVVEQVLPIPAAHRALEMLLGPGCAGWEYPGAYGQGVVGTLTPQHRQGWGAAPVLRINGCIDGRCIQHGVHRPHPVGALYLRRDPVLRSGTGAPQRTAASAASTAGSATWGRHLGGVVSVRPRLTTGAHWGLLVHLLERAGVL